MKNCTEGIVQSVDAEMLDHLNSVSERYYEHRYCMKVDGIEGDIHQRLCFHSNRIVMLSLAENHPVMKNRKEVSRVRWQVDSDTDRRKSAAVGKGKKGAHKLRSDSVVCYIDCTDDNSYPVYSCIPGGKLLEVNNEQLEADPNLLVSKPVSTGYIALVLPHLHMYESFKESLLTQHQYTDTIRCD